MSRRLVLLAWLVVATIIGVSGLYERSTPVIVALTIWGLVLATLVAARRWPALRNWWPAADLRLPVAFHLTRFVGVWFLVLYSRGELPWGFAVPGGIGDTIVALGVVALLATGVPRRALLAWNIFGAVDILLVVVAALRLGLADPAQMAALRAFPLALLPLFVVPVIILTHMMIFARLQRSR